MGAPRALGRRRGGEGEQEAGREGEVELEGRRERAEHSDVRHLELREGGSRPGLHAESQRSSRASEHRGAVLIETRSCTATLPPLASAKGGCSDWRQQWFSSSNSAYWRMPPTFRSRDRRLTCATRSYDKVEIRSK